MKKVKYFPTVVLAVLLFAIAFAGCANKKVAVGKYYAESSTESFIEILEDETALFVNVDLSKIQEDHDNYGEDINVTELTSVPVPYVLGTDDHIMFECHEYYALWAVYDFENKTITFGGDLFYYQA